MIEQVPSRLETWLHDIFKESGQLTARRICRDYRIPERLELTGLQVDLFRAYFAAYYSLQDVGDIAYLERHPGSEALNRLPVLNFISRLPSAVCRISQAVADEFFASAKTTADIIKATVSQSAQTSARRIVTEHFRIDDLQYEALRTSTPEIEAQIETLIAAISEKFLQSIGTPAEIRNAANLLSGTYVAHKKSGRSELGKALEKTLGAIRIGPRAPHRSWQ